MKIIIGADHGGYELKNYLSEWLKSQNHEVKDIGTFSSESIDYPDIAQIVAEEVAKKKFERGILICGSGVGVAIAANKVNGVRAVNAHDVILAKLSREHNDTNVLTMGGRFVAKELAEEIVQTWIKTEFSGGRHEKRIDKIAEIEKQNRKD